MAKIIFKSNNADKVTAVLSKIYQLNAESYTSDELDNGDIFIEILDDRKVDSRFIVDLENNGLEAYLYLYPGVNEGKIFTITDIKEMLELDGIKVNVKDDELQKAHNEYMQGYIIERLLIAEGEKPQPGIDASIILQFSSGIKRPKIDFEGKIDFKNVDNIIHAKQGDILIVKRPPSDGKKGLTVKNTEILPPGGKDIEIQCGEGVEINPAGTNYYSTKDGYVEFRDNYIAVHEVLFLDNVDLSSGNVKFSGTVHVQGDILAGFRVEAGSDVIVDGICSDAEVIAGNNIIVNTGIKGNGNNLFKAEGDITVGYCEKGRLFAKNNIKIYKYAYHSELYSGGVIEAIVGDGIIAGGVAKAYSEIRVKQLGTQGNSKFNIYIGTKYYIDNALEKIRDNKLLILDALNKINDVLLNFNVERNEVKNHIKVRKLLDHKAEFEAILSIMNSKEESLLSQARADKPKIKVKGYVYDGITIMFFNCATTIKDRLEDVVFYLNEKFAEVSYVSMKDNTDGIENEPSTN